MLLEHIVRLNLLEDNADSNIVPNLPVSVRRAIVTEITNYFHQSGALVGIPGGALSTASTPTTMTSSLKNYGLGSHSSVSAITTGQEEKGSSIGLTTISQLDWILEVLGAAFSLPLDEINVISNATSLYLNWLIDSAKRPSALHDCSPLQKEKFSQRILGHISQLFDPKKIDTVGAGKPLLATYASKHVELCKVVLKVLSHYASISEEYSQETLKYLIKILLGITDNLLRRPATPYCYLTDEISEPLLSTTMEVILRSQLFSRSIWKSVQELYLNWCHRLLCVNQWNALALALTQRVTKILYGQGTKAVVYTVNSNLVTIDISDDFAVFAWNKIIQSLGRPSALTPQVFFRAVLGVEKLIQVFHSIGQPSVDDIVSIPMERFFPSGNTLLDLFGKWLFEAASRTGSEFAEGRAQSLGVLCRIFSKMQNRECFKMEYIHKFYAALMSGLQGDLLCTVFIVVNCEDILSWGLPGISILIPQFVASISRIIPQLEKSLRINLNIHDLRRACYKLLCTTIGPCSFYHNLSIPSPQSHIMSPRLNTVTESNEKLPQPSLLSNCNTYGDLRVGVVNLLMNCFVSETDTSNLRYLLNTLAISVFDQGYKDASQSLGIIQMICTRLCGSELSSDVLQVAIETLKSFESFLHGSNRSSLDSDPGIAPFVVRSLLQLLDRMISRNEGTSSNLTVIASILDCSLVWICGSNLDANWFVRDLEIQHALLTILCRGLLNRSHSSNESVTPASSKVVYSEGSVVNLLEDFLLEFFNKFGKRSSSPFIPINTSSLISESSLFRGQDIWESSIHKLKYFCVSGESIYCFAECDNSKGFIIIARNRNGLLSFKVSPLYENSKSPQQPIFSTSDSLFNTLTSRSKIAKPLSSELLVDDFSSQFPDRFKSNLDVVANQVTQQVSQLKSAVDAVHLKFESFKEVAPEEPGLEACRLFFSHLGLNSIENRSLVSPLTANRDLLKELSDLDKIINREIIKAAVVYVESASRSLPEIVANTKITPDFVNFLNSLGWNVRDDPSCPQNSRLAFLDPFTDIEFVSPVISSCSNSENEDNLADAFLNVIKDELVMIVWTDDLEEVLALPNRLKTKAIVYILISPIRETAGLYRIRMMVSNPSNTPLLAPPQPASTNLAGSVSDFIFVFGPLLDGAIVRRESLSLLIRLTATSAGLYCRYHLLQEMKPSIKRAQIIQFIGGKFRGMNQTISRYYNEFLYSHI